MGLSIYASFVDLSANSVTLSPTRVSPTHITKFLITKLAHYSNKITDSF